MRQRLGSWEHFRRGNAESSVAAALIFAALIDARKMFFDVDCRGASITEIGGGEIGRRRLMCRTSWTLFPLDGLTATIAFDI